VCPLIGGWFDCGKDGYFARNCLTKRHEEMHRLATKNQKPKTQGRVDALTQQNTHVSHSVVTSALLYVLIVF